MKRRADVRNSLDSVSKYFILVYILMIPVTSYLLTKLGVSTAEVISVVLSMGLLFFYWQQTELNRAMVNKKNADYKPSLKVGVDFLSEGLHPILFIRNSGKAAAHDVEVKWEIGSKSNSWSIPVIPPENEHKFPIFVEDGNWVLNRDKIEKKLEDEEETHLKCSYSRTDILGCKEEKQENVNIMKSIRGRESNEIVQKDNIRRIRKELEGINDNLIKLRRTKH